jgi:hypothetical protein
MTVISLIQKKGEEEEEEEREKEENERKKSILDSRLMQLGKSSSAVTTASLSLSSL